VRCERTNSGVRHTVADDGPGIPDTERAVIEAGTESQLEHASSLGLRVERGLYVCSSCEMTMNADVNGAVNIRRKITRSPPTGDMSNGCLAQPGVYLFDRESGRFTPREQGDCKP
jgi:hypothetical protein